MFWIYLASAIFGGSFLIPMIVGGLSSDVAMDFDTDVDVDLDVDMDMDMDMDVGGDVEVGSDTAAFDGVDGEGVSPVGAGLDAGLDAGQAILGSILSFRSIVFFASFFGAAGLVFGALGYRVVITALTALALGLLAAIANSALFGLLKSSQSSSQVGERSFQGRPASVTVPIEPGRRGRIRIDLAGQPHYIVAESYTPDEALVPGRSVVVVEMERGIAIVAPLPELE